MSAVNSPVDVERKLQDQWRAEGLHRAIPDPREDRDDAYVFVPPVRGAGLTPDQLRAIVIGDVRARYRRARGDRVLFTSAIDESGDAARDQLHRLGASLTWDRVPSFSDAAARAWAQWLFLRLRASGAIQEQHPGGPFVLRLAHYLEENHRALDDLAWSDRARDWQESIIAPIKGVELAASGIDGTPLPVFTEHGDKLSQAKLVALSPHHPDIEKWARSVQAQQELATLALGDKRVIATGLFAWVPSVEKLLPVVITAAVHDRIGASALLVIPKADKRDGVISDGFVGSTTTSYNYRGKRTKPVPAARFITPDLPVTTATPDGIPVPLAQCATHGTVESTDGTCPECGAAATPDDRVLDHVLLDALSWAVLEDAPSDTPAALQRWTGASTLIATAGSGAAVQGMRTIGKALHELGATPDGEPFREAFVLEGVDARDELDVDAALKTAGADALRVAILHSAAGDKPLTWKSDQLVGASRLLERVRAFAQPRLGALQGTTVDLTAPRRRDSPDLARLDRWTDVAVIKITENLDALDTHRATRNVQALLERIEDFDARTSGAEPEATAVALLTLAKLAGPLAPHLAEELWALAGQPGTAAGAPWPTPRER